MEKKRMGAFIAALRKAQGLTQRELAERLGVSDKAVSRWEREECMPDLSLIPAIADLFGVTADELLRGQRSSAAPVDPDREAQKAERELRNLLRRRTDSFLSGSLAAAGTALLGVPVAVFFNAANRAELGFYAACFFLLTAAFLEAVLLTRAFHSMGEETTGEAVDACKRTLACWAGRVFLLVAALTGGLLPLVILPAKTPFLSAGLKGLSWPLYGTLSGAAFLALAAGVNALVRRCLPFFPRTQQQKERDRLGRRCALGAVFAMLCTVPLHYMLSADTALYRQDLSFDRYEDFVAYISHREEGDPASGGAEEERADYRLRSIVNNQGQTVCTYRNRNQNAVSVSYPNTETCLPIRVGTLEGQRRANEIAGTVGQVLFLLYPLEAGAAALAFFLLAKRRQAPRRRTGRSGPTS